MEDRLVYNGYSPPRQENMDKSLCSTLETMASAVYSVGRFQPPTIGHAAMIQTLVDTRKPAFVFVSSSTSPKEKNPLTSTEKVAFLRKMFPRGVTFVDTATCDPKCGGPVAAREYLVTRGYTDLTLVGGSDREVEFGPTSRIWEYLQKPEYDGPVKTPPRFLALRRNGTGSSTMSGTKARALAVSGKFEEFKRAVTVGDVTEEDVWELYTTLRSRLQPKRKGGTEDETDISMFDADQEGQGGRRKKTRRNKKRRSTSSRVRRRAQ